MSKLSEFQEQIRIKEAEAERQTVSEFAVELRKPTDLLLIELQEAGVPKVSGLDCLTSMDKAKLLHYLQRLHGAERRRKRVIVTIESEEQKLIKRAAKLENGAELEALQLFAGAVLWGDAIDPTFQKMVNLIVAKAVLNGALPPEKLGRPKRKELESIGLKAAHRYWGMIDSGIRYEQAVETLSAEFNKSERHIMRLIEKHKKTIGDTPEIRTRNREWHEMMRESFRRTPDMFDRYLKLYESRVPFPELNLDDYLDHLVELTSELVAKVKPLTKKI